MDVKVNKRKFFSFQVYKELIMDTRGIDLCYEKKQQELTLRAIFLSLFIAENCFKRLKTAESRGLSGATPST